MPGGQGIFTLSDGKVRQWSHSGRLLRSMPENLESASVKSASVKSAAAVRPSPLKSGAAAEVKPQAVLYQLEVSPTQQIAALDMAHQIWLWDLKSGWAQLKLEAQNPVVPASRPQVNQPELLRFSPDGQMLVTASAAEPHTAYLWDSRTGALLGKLAGHRGRITALQFTPDGTYILTADATGCLRGWSAQRGGELPGLQLSGELEWAAFLPGLMPSSQDAALDRPNPGGTSTWQKWQQAARLNTAVSQIPVAQTSINPTPASPPPAPPTPATQTSVTQMVAVASDGQLRQWKILTDRPASANSATSVSYLAAIQPPTTAAQLRDRLLSFWPGSRPLDPAASGFMQLPQTAMIQPFGPQAGLEDIESGFPVSRAALTGFAMSAEGTLSARADLEGGVAVYQMVAKGPRLLYRIESWRSSNQAVQAAESLSSLVTPGVAANSPKPHNAPTIVRHLAFSPNGQQLLGVADDLTIRTWDARSGQALAVLRGHRATIQQARYSQDSQWIISASWDKTARVWQAGTGQETQQLKHIDAVSSAGFSPDGQRAVTTSWNGSARVWQVATGEAKFTLDQHQKSVLDAEFSPDGKLIVTASADGTARLWDAGSGEEQAVLKAVSASGQPEAVVRAFFSPDSQYVATLDKSGRISLWAATWDMLLRLAQERSLRQLTPEECSRYLRLSSEQCPSLPL